MLERVSTISPFKTKLYIFMQTLDSSSTTPLITTLSEDERLAHKRYWEGGATIGSKHYCYPFAELEFTEDGLIMRLADRQIYKLHPDQVTKLKISPCKSPGIPPAAAICFCHQVKKYPDQIAFLIFCYDAEPYIRRLKKAGFCIDV